MNMEQLLQAGERVLFQSEIAEAKIDAWYLMEYYFHLNRVSFWVNSKKTVNKNQETEYLNLIQRRSEHIPLQYITGEQIFMGLPFKVTPDVLIPRQDTECLVEKVLCYSKGKTVLDMCTGSGCIAVSLSKLGEPAQVTGVDISEKALLVAAENGKKNQAPVQWIKSDLFQEVKGVYDMIVSNPPYIESRLIEKLMPEVSVHEPRIALDGFSDGLYFYREIIKQARKYLSKEGRLFFEIGYNQGEDVEDLLKKEKFTEIEMIKDLSGLNRIVCGKC
ncbi:MAG: peptide chain release factor N(5)-glutamine methyltransferase [Acetivibrio sp.]